MKEYNKLVRNLIPKVIEKSGKKFDIHIAKSVESKKLLEAKLLEENNLEELADVMEILVGLAGYLGYTEEELFEKRKQKKVERGGFDEGVMLERVWE